MRVPELVVMASLAVLFVSTTAVGEAKTIKPLMKKEVEVNRAVVGLKTFRCQADCRCISQRRGEREPNSWPNVVYKKLSPNPRVSFQYDEMVLNEEVAALVRHSPWILMIRGSDGQRRQEAGNACKTACKKKFSSFTGGGWTQQSYVGHFESDACRLALEKKVVLNLDR